jgi:hypothetical protein
MKHALCVLMLFFISPLSIAQIYKWVDENGKTHYSQTPPPVKQKTKSVQKMATTGALLKIDSEKRGHYLYCGNLLILSDRGGDDILLENIKLSLRDWEVERNKQEKHIKSLKQPGTKWNQKKIRHEQEKLAEYECRVKWSYDKLKQLTSFGYQARKTNAELEARYDYLKKQQDKHCPADSKRFGGILIGDAARDWYECHDKYSRKMKSIKKKIKENIRSASEAE